MPCGTRCRGRWATPALEIAYRVDQEWVDEVRSAGAAARPRGERRRVVTLVEDGGRPWRRSSTTPPALRDAMLAQSVGAAVRLVLANVRLQAEDAARTRDVAASRRRLVEAGDEQRRVSASSCASVPSRRWPRCPHELDGDRGVAAG